MFAAALLEGVSVSAEATAWRLWSRLSFKGRRGSGITGSRCAYADTSLNPRWDWQKYEYTTRVWGRLLYNPERSPGGVAAGRCGGSLGRAQRRWKRRSRTSAGFCRWSRPCMLRQPPTMLYWPELYCNQSIVDAEHYEPYSDSETPRVFGNASPFDPELFLSMNDCAEELLEGKASGKYTPIEVAQWIEDFAADGRGGARRKRDAVGNGSDKPEYRRARVDIEIQASLGEFFGAKFRSGVLYHVYARTKNQTALKAGIEQYQEGALGIRGGRARRTGRLPGRHHVWRTELSCADTGRDRLPAMDKDIAASHRRSLDSSSADRRFSKVQLRRSRRRSD